MTARRAKFWCKALPFLLSVSGGFLSSGCAKVDNRSSVLVIVIDRLGVDSVTCSSEAPGFLKLCDESLRFTHGYTTSTLSAPAMGSILTGQYPYETGLHHNGGGELGVMSSSVESVAELALREGFRTAFFAGSAPLLRRTGLHQGFEIFDDSITTDNVRLHRPAHEVVDLFLQWQAQIQKSNAATPFFAVLHFGDLQFPWAPTLDESGRPRENTVKAQIDEIDSSLTKLWSALEQRRQWDRTTITLAGLQGDSVDKREDEIPALDLHSQMSHVALMVKEGRKAHYQWTPKSWTFDANVSLADLGATLVYWVTGRDRSSESVRSFHALLKGPGEESELWRKDERFLPTESAWAKWVLADTYPIRSSLRKGPYLFINDERPMIYNTLTDAYEMAPLPSRSEKTLVLQREFQAHANGLGFRPFPNVPAYEIRKELWARELFSKRLGARVVTQSSLRDRLLDDERAVTDPQLSFWLFLESWSAGGAVAPRTPCADVVFSTVESTSSIALDASIAKRCAFRGAREIAKWFRLRHSSDAEKDRVFESIVRVDRQRLSAVRVAETNLALGRIWESGSTRLTQLEGLETLLAQPEAQRLQQQVMRRSRSSTEP